MTPSPPIPRDAAFDSTLSLLSEGYRFIPDRARRLGSDIFETRLMLRKAVCITGEEAARIFYAPDRFTRRGAIPVTTEPGAFRPERFHDREPEAFDLIPQGAGNHHAGHRCPGEWITIAVMKAAVRLLTGAMRYDVPAQDLRIDLSRMPAVPASRFVIRNVAPAADMAQSVSG